MAMRKLITFALAVMLLPSAALADELRLECKNPRQPYLVVYDRVARTFIIDPDTDRVSYRIIVARVARADGLVGHNSGLTFKADFGPHPRIEFYSGAKLVQTDQCEQIAIDLMGN